MLIQGVYRNAREPEYPKQYWKRRTKLEDFLISKCTTKQQQSRHKDRHRLIKYKWKPRNKHVYSQRISDKDAKEIQEERCSLSINGAGTTGYPHAKKDLLWIPISHHPQKLIQNGLQN